MKIGFLIVNYNDYQTTEKIIQNIKNYKFIDRIVIVDNNSTDDSFEKLSNMRHKNIDIIKNSENKGYGSGINFGSRYLINQIGNCYIIISNPDIVIYSEDDLKRLIKTFDDETAIVAPIIKEHEGFNRGWKTPSPLQDAALNLFYIHRFLRPKMLFYHNEFYSDEIVEVETVSGCFFIIDSRYLEKANYFDENIFLYYEENTISKKMKMLNKKIKINTKVEVFHNHSVTIDKNINHIKKYKELKKSQMYFQKKYNHANVFELMLLWLTNKMTLLLLYIVVMLKRT